MTIHLPRYILIFDKTNFRISLQKGAIMRTVILTFDDAVISQYENVAPLLKELGFGATFFICRFNDEWRAKNEQYLMTPDQLRQLDRDGFEIANHTWNHILLTDCAENVIEQEIILMNQYFTENGIPAPVSFAYPGGPFAKNAVEVLKRHNFLCARSVRNEAYHPAKDDCMNLPAFSIRGNDPDFFRNAIAQADDENPVILVFHGVPEYVHPWVDLDMSLFREYMNILKEENYRVCSLRDWFQK